MSGLSRKEAEIRSQLNSIREFRTEVNAPDPELKSMRAIGADILWNRWLDQTQTQLNMSLAGILAKKEQAARRVRKDVGRAETVRQLCLDADAERETAGRKKGLDRRMVMAAEQGMMRKRI